MIIINSEYGCVYSILNINNNKAYIGISSDFNKRVRDHKNRLRKNIHSNKYLQNSWNKHGEECFKFINIIDNILIKELYEFEKKFIKLFNANNQKYGYNLTDGGKGLEGYKHTKDYIQSLKKPRPELSGNLHPFYNKKHSDEVKKVISEAMKKEGNGMYGKKHSKETKNKISKSMKANKNSSKKLSNKDIIKIKNMLNKGLTQVEISNKLNISQPMISLVKNNKY